MKTKEEIEQFAEQWFENANTERWGGEVDGFIQGYIDCQHDMAKELYEFGKLVLDTFHSEGKTHSGKARLARIEFDAWFNSLNKQD